VKKPYYVSESEKPKFHPIIADAKGFPRVPNRFLRPPTRNVILKTPFMSSPVDTVTEASAHFPRSSSSYPLTSPLVIHHNHQLAAAQVDMVHLVKLHENGPRNHVLE